MAIVARRAALQALCNKVTKEPAKHSQIRVDR